MKEEFSKWFDNWRLKIFNEIEEASREGVKVMRIISDIKLLFEKHNINLFEAIDSIDSRNEVFFIGKNNLQEFIQYLTMNNIKYSFYNYSEVTDDSLINLELITEEVYGFEAKRFMKEAIEYNKLVNEHVGEMLTTNIFTVHNDVMFTVIVISDVKNSIEEDGEDALFNITNEYWDALELHKFEREQELLNEVEEDRIQERKQKIQKFYELLEKDKYFANLTTKDGRIMRATELASEIGLNETKTNIVGHLDVFTAKKKMLEKMKQK